MIILIWNHIICVEINWNNIEQVLKSFGPKFSIWSITCPSFSEMVLTNMCWLGFNTPYRTNNSFDRPKMCRSLCGCCKNGVIGSFFKDRYKNSQQSLKPFNYNEFTSCFIISTKSLPLHILSQPEKKNVENAELQPQKAARCTTWETSMYHEDLAWIGSNLGPVSPVIAGGIHTYSYNIRGWDLGSPQNVSVSCHPGSDSIPSWIAICQQWHPGSIPKVYLPRILKEPPWVFSHKGPTRRKPRFKNVDALGTPKVKFQKKIFQTTTCRSV